MCLNLLRHQDTPAAVTLYSSVIPFLCGDLIATVKCPCLFGVLCSPMEWDKRLLASGEIIPKKCFWKSTKLCRYSWLNEAGSYLTVRHHIYVTCGHWVLGRKKRIKPHSIKLSLNMSSPPNPEQWRRFRFVFVSKTLFATAQRHSSVSSSKTSRCKYGNLLGRQEVSIPCLPPTESTYCTWK